MTWTATGADVGAMATGLSALTAAFVWTRNQLTDWRNQRQARAYRNWHGYIDSSGIDSWYVRVVEQPQDAPISRVVLDVVNRQGQPDIMAAQGLRIRAEGDGMLARAPTSEEYDFLAELVRKRRWKGGFLVRFGRQADTGSDWPIDPT